MPADMQDFSGSTAQLKVHAPGLGRCLTAMPQRRPAHVQGPLRVACPAAGPLHLPRLQPADNKTTYDEAAAASSVQLE